ncbi:unnamed protein product [Ceutorhynchus assimilis]|uniref:GH18 domain-containing protein n=1 Tax=Ceutorhynchus assimilis TaxID=467358 RepID=A0A9N9QRS2_9CUCU|nr:unnamed protein product [Ceutorhynchus assimilis]
MKGIFLFLVLAIALVNSTKKEIVCYFTNWAIYRPGIGLFQTSDIDSSLCTIINYAFVGLWGDTGEVRVLDDFSDVARGNLKGVIGLKQNNTNLKVLASMGGWNEGSKNYSIVAANATLRSNFIKSVLKYVQDNDFDGFDFDWEYPTARGGLAEDVENYIILLQELNAALKAANTGYLLTVAVAGAGEQVELSYNVPALTKVVDYVFCMMYDFRIAPSTNYTAHHSPLNYSSLDITEETRILSVYGGIQQWLSLGANASKLILGLAFYGRSFELVDLNDNGLYAASNGTGPAGPLTRTAGFISYQEICNYYGDYTHVWDEEQQAPHAYLNNDWFSYDNARSLKLKTIYALSSGFAGVMIWDLDFDDFNNSCGNGTFPLLTAINEAVASYGSAT